MLETVKAAFPKALLDVTPPIRVPATLSLFLPALNLVDVSGVFRVTVVVEVSRDMLL